MGKKWTVVFPLEKNVEALHNFFFIVGILFPCIPSKQCPPDWGRPYPHFWGFRGGTNGKEPPCQCRRHRKCRFNPWVRKIPWRRAWQPTPVFLAGGFHGQRNLMRYSPWGLQRIRHDWTDLACTQTDFCIVMSLSSPTSLHIHPLSNLILHLHPGMPFSSPHKVLNWILMDRKTWIRDE